MEEASISVEISYSDIITGKR